MKVFIMRHGEASTNAPNDHERGLTFQGEQQCRLVAKWLRMQSVSIDYVMVSPYLRAKQTLDLLRNDMKLLGKIETSAMITPSADPLEVKNYLFNLAKKGVKNILLVSHLPLVGYLVSELCPSVKPPAFNTSSIACISIDPVTNENNFEWMHN